MQFMDELRGSIGERCMVVNLQHGTVFEASVTALDEENGQVKVTRDDGREHVVGYGLVQLLGEEDD